ncbi:MAG TPA: cytochrome c [Candidatus Agrococcus pullicola]|uniref:Cytochrome bc1 complex cytochrome c subunit n=1 Tax=Candidatus Agrococcus pullicola TaxID=2838429 RepID=A0A9D1YV56_9MICO|nr:cytochrome c [Candidatus Agrococcus pullicola]
MAKRKTSGRRHPLASAALLILGLVVVGGIYTAVDQAADAQSPSHSEAALTAADGEALYMANCATCHGVDAVGTEYGPTLVGVGPASVNFQIMTGRMPMAFQGPQADQREVMFTQEQSDAIGEYLQTFGPGPESPDEEWLDTSATGVDVANGAELFRINCAMCHNVAGAGGALTEGKFAPNLHNIDAAHIYEAMLTGPQNMPVFNDNNISPEEKRDVIAYLHYMDENPSAGGFSLGSLGPVSEGLFIWIFGLGSIVALTVWLTSRPN